jgi:uncharacterized protein YbaR (Trm112 family)
LESANWPDGLDIDEAAPSWLLELLVCPVDHGALDRKEPGLRCATCGRTYPIRGGIPVMLADESERVF